MTILYLHQYFKVPSSTGGIRSYDLAKRFVEKGNKVIMITSSAFISVNTESRWAIEEIDGIEVHILDVPYSNKMSFMKRIISFVSFSFFASFHILKLKGDVVLATSTPLSIAIPALIKKRLGKTPYIFEVRDVWPEVPIGMGIIKNRVFIKLLVKFELYVYKHASSIVALSTDMKDSILKRSKEVKNVTVIPNISEIDRFKVSNSKKPTITKKKIVLYAGTIGIVNNIEYVVKLAEEIYRLDKNVEFHIYGDGNRKSQVETLAKVKGVINKNFFLKGTVSKSELPEIYSRCTVSTSFVANIPALWANSANKYFDTLAASKPIVINHYGWQADEIESTNLGFVLNPDENIIPQTAVSFVNYLNNEELLAKQSNNAYGIAVQKYSLSCAEINYIKVLKNSLSDV